MEGGIPAISMADDPANGRAGGRVKDGRTGGVPEIGSAPGASVEVLVQQVAA